MVKRGKQNSKTLPELQNGLTKQIDQEKAQQEHIHPSIYVLNRSQSPSEG